MFGGNRMKKYTIQVCSIMIVFYTLLAFNNVVLGEELRKEEELQLTKGAKASLLLERDTGEILYEQNAHEKLPPASLTKVMTLLLVMEALDVGQIKEDEIITVSERAASMGGSQVFLAAGEQMAVKDLIKAVAIASANDASVALAERIAGSEQAFVKRMNEKVEELGLKNTKFQNSSGLPAEDHYTTAYDIAMMSKELLRYESITDYTSIYEDYLRKGEENEFWLVNTNRLVRFYPYVDGLKTGYTKEAKFCLAATAEKDDMRVVSVVMGAETSKERNRMTMDLIDYAFSHYETERIYNRGENISHYIHLQSEKHHYKLKTSESISLLRKKGEDKLDYETEIKIDKDKPLPIEKGEQIGSIIVRTPDERIVQSPIYTDERIDLASIGTLMKRTLKMIVKYE